MGFIRGNRLSAEADEAPTSDNPPSGKGGHTHTTQPARDVASLEGYFCLGQKHREGYNQYPCAPCGGEAFHAT